MNWIIVTPIYSNSSNGIKNLHEICHQLNNNGENAYLLYMELTNNPYHPNLFVVDNATDSNLNTKTLPQNMATKEIIENSIVIYPEILHGNPLNSKYVIRWYGNRPENTGLKQNLSTNINEYIISFSKIFIKNYNSTLFNPSLDEVFYNNKINLSNKKIDIVYHGKSQSYGIKTEVFDNTLYLSRENPKDKIMLSNILKQCRFFYTYDSLSNINTEAIAAGAIPVFLNYFPWTEEEIDCLELGEMPRGKLVNILNNCIYAEVDIKKYIEKRYNYLNNIIKYRQEYINKYKNLINDIKNFFNIR